MFDIFIKRPVATTLLTLAVVWVGVLGFFALPVSPLPQVDYPTISVQASLPGASPEVMAATVATPLERTLGRIAGVTELTSSSSLGSTRITLQFDLDRNIDSAAREVQAGINAARDSLPSGMPSNPTYRKVNPAEAPIMILALTSDRFTQGQMYDIASTLLAQKIAQLEGIGQVTLGGSSLPAIRVAVDPTRLSQMGLSLEALRSAISSANVNRPKGFLENASQRWQIGANDQIQDAATLSRVLIAYRNDRGVRLGDVARVTESVQDLRNAGSANGKPAVLLLLNRQPGANILDTVTRVKAVLPALRASIPAGIDLTLVQERTTTIRAALHDVELSLLIAVALVILVVFLFLRDSRAALIPSVAVPVSLLGTFALMYACGFSLNNLSLMALTIATGFVVDDAIVVLENIKRHVENGMKPLAAALLGTREVGFTVLSMSISLVAVFIPILLMGGIVGRLFREFAVTLSGAILVSLLISLTTTPMLCARWLRASRHKPSKASAGTNGVSASHSSVTLIGLRGYERSLRWVLRHQPWMLLLLFATIGLNLYLYLVIPKSFFPQQDTGRLSGFIQADQSVSFEAMRGKMQQFITLVRQDPAVDNVVAFTGGGGQRNGGAMFISLKPKAARGGVPVEAVIARMRQRLAKVAGANLFLQPVQDIRVGGRQGNAEYQYTLQADTLEDLRIWEPRVRRALDQLSELTDINTDQQDRGLQTTLTIDRNALARLGLTMRDVSGTLNSAYSQRQISVLYNPLNQYQIVLEVEPAFQEGPYSLQYLHVVNRDGLAIPLMAFTTVKPTTTALRVNHQGQFPATTIAFNLSPGVTLGQATVAIDEAIAKLGVPSSVQSTFQGNAKAFKASLDSQPWLILAALMSVYIVLGILYESLIHPLTILSTLPSAGVGALLALLLCKTPFSLIALIGVILLIGIVKKNAIMMIDFALVAERRDGMNAHDAIVSACLARFRPILMTTMAALLGALPLAVGLGEGSEFRQPLGIAIIGGLVISQLLTLYTTPVVYLYLDRLQNRLRPRRVTLSHA